MVETIVALSSPPGSSPRAVLRLSGPAARSLAGRVFSPLPARGWRHAVGLLELPGWPPAPAAALVFRAPRSYTGEDVVELWVPGAPPLVRRLLLTLEDAGARLADRGEFTRRAFLAGRLDLLQVEAVLALTTSEDARVACASLRALTGGVGGRVDAVKGGVLEVRAHVEAAIDFSEEEIDLATPGRLAARLRELSCDLRALVAESGYSPQARTEPVVVLRGAVNAGKSTLFNALARDRTGALVSSEAGTTRDVVEGTWRLPGGERVRLLDTAGAKSPDGEVEARALAAAEEACASADLQLVVVPGADADPEVSPGQLLVRSKADLARAQATGIAVCAPRGEGLPELAAEVQRRLFGAEGAPAGLCGSVRQAAQLRAATDALERAATVLDGDDPARAELAAVDLADGLEALGALTGEVTTDDMLDVIFGAFCIGK